VPVRRHSANTSLPSARFGALGKVNILIFKNLCRVPHRGHSAKKLNLTDRQLLLLLSLTHAHSLSRRRHRARRRPRARPRRWPCARARRRPSSRRRPCPATSERRRRNTPAPTRPARRHRPRPRRRPPHAPGTPPSLPAPSTVSIIVICYLIY
jgi:hypothetical protein